MCHLRGLLAVLAILAVPHVAHAQRSSVRVVLELVAPTLADTTPVFVTGGLPQLGEWNPARVRLTPRGNHTWSAVIVLDGAGSFEFKFTLGAWEHEAADSAGAALPNLVARVTGDTTIATTVRAWTSGPRARVLNGQVTGTLTYHRAITGAGLASRDLVVWLPPGYDAGAIRRYPVLYMLDGQNVFDPATSSFGADWAVDEAADSLIRAKIIEPLIIVGVYNTANRSAEYLPGTKATEFMDFMVHTVKPLIDSVYATRRDARSTMVGGSSAGGISAFMMVWENPGVFSRALAMSPAFQAPRGSQSTLDYVAEVRLSARLVRNVRFYIDIGGVGLEERLRPGVDAMVAALVARRYVEGRDLLVVRDPAAQHNELAWRARFPAALAWIMRP